MGCDIHIHAEIKINGKWHHYDQPQCGRHYQLFERMAGVRGDVKNAIAPPRGIPKNASFTTKFDKKMWGTDGHSHSWLSSKELHELSEWQEKELNEDWIKQDWNKWFFGNNYSDFYKYPTNRTKDIEDVRFIFWFDN